MKTSNKILLGVLILIAALGIFPVIYLKMNLKEMKKEQVVGNGQMTRQSREVSSFKGIHSGGILKVYLTQGAQKLELEGESNLLDLVETAVEGGHLLLKMKPGVTFNTKSEVKVHISTPELEEIELSGAGSVTTDSVFKSNDLVIVLSGVGEMDMNLESQHVVTNLVGSGKILLRGKTARLEATCSGAGQIEAQDLEAGEVEATCSGVGSVKVFPVQSLNATVGGVGNIYYRGDPASIKTKEGGIGKILKM